MGGNLVDIKLPIVVVEDEKEIRELMALHLLRKGFQVIELSSAEELLTKIQNQSFPLIIMDWMLPGISGVEATQKVKMIYPQTSILMVTAKTEPQDIVEGLEKGADDYLTKPFEPSVFIARVNALMRRHQIQTEKNSKNSQLIDFNGLKVNLDSYEVEVYGKPLHLTPSEYKLLVNLVQSRGKVLTRENLIENIQGEGINVIGRTIDTHVFGLRKKLAEWGENIETIRGVGYRVRVE